jgi:hypothetical protein
MFPVFPRLSPLARILHLSACRHDGYILVRGEGNFAAAPSGSSGAAFLGLRISG